jgi:hypothetical protein
VDVSFNARLVNGLVLQGGTSTGRGVQDTCDVETGRFGRPQRIVDGQPACDITEPFQTSFRGLAAYTLPKIDVLVSAIFRSPGECTPWCGRRHQRRLACGELSNDRGSVPRRDWDARCGRVSHRKPSTSFVRATCTAIASTRSTCASPRSCG